MRRAAAAVLLVLFLAGCGEGAAGVEVSVDVVPRPGGGQLECATNGAGGIDCDWDGARR